MDISLFELVSLLPSINIKKITLVSSLDKSFSTITTDDLCHLSFQNQRVTLPSIDSRTVTARGVFFALGETNTDSHQYIEDAFQNGACICIGSKPITEIHIKSDLGHTNIAKIYIEVNDVLKSLQILAKNYRSKYLVNTTVIGVTGSVGKTSVKDMLYSALQSLHPFATEGNLNNHIGVPLSVLSINPKCTHAILEAGMNHRGELKVLAEISQPNIVVITKIGVAHIEYLKTQEEIALEKLDLALYSPLVSAVYIPAIDAYADFIQDQIQTHNKNHDTKIICTKTKPAENKSLELEIIGAHMQANAWLVYSVAQSIGIPDQEIINHLQHAVLTPRRMEIHSLPQNIVLIDDTYNANPDSMKAGLVACNEYVNTDHVNHALENQFKSRIAILGGMGELGEQSMSMHQDIAKFIDTLPNITEVYFVGELAKQYTAHNTNKVSRFFETIPACISHIQKNNTFENALFFIKGSKSTHMSELADLLLEHIKKTVK